MRLNILWYILYLSDRAIYDMSWWRLYTLTSSQVDVKFAVINKLLEKKHTKILSTVYQTSMLVLFPRVLEQYVGFQNRCQINLESLHVIVTKITLLL